MVVATGTMADGRVQVILGLDLEAIEALKREPLVVSRETHGEVVPANLVISLYSGASNTEIADRIKAERGGQDTQVPRILKLIEFLSTVPQDFKLDIAFWGPVFSMGFAFVALNGRDYVPTSVEGFKNDDPASETTLVGVVQAARFRNKPDMVDTLPRLYAFSKVSGSFQLFQ